MDVWKGTRDKKVARPSWHLPVHGFTNRDLRDKLLATSVPLSAERKRQSAQVGRLLSRLHLYGLVAKIPHSRRWRVTAFGHRVMSASVRLGTATSPPSTWRPREILKTSSQKTENQRRKNLRSATAVSHHSSPLSVSFPEVTRNCPRSV